MLLSCHHHHHHHQQQNYYCDYYCCCFIFGLNLFCLADMSLKFHTIIMLACWVLNLYPQFVRMFIICLHRKFHIPISNCLLVTAVKLKAKLGFLHGTHVFFSFYLLQKSYRNKSFCPTSFQDPTLSGVSSAPISVSSCNQNVAITDCRKLENMKLEQVFNDISFILNFV
jgi:hypothetical protein